MLNKHFVRATLLGALLSSTAPAFAEMTPQSALDRYFALNTSFGLDMTVGDKSQNGDTVRWSDISITEPSGEAITTIDWVEAAPAGNNTVLITTSPTAQSVITDPEGEFTTTINMALNDLQTYVTEDDDVLSFSFSGSRVDITTDAAKSTAPLSMQIAMTDISGAYAMTAEDRIDGTMATGPMTVAYGIDDGEVVMSSNSTIGSMEAAFGIDIATPETMMGYLDGTRNLSVEYTFKDTSTNASFGGDEGEGNFVTNVDVTTADIEMKDGTLSANGTASNLTYQVMAMEMGIPPIDASIAEASSDILFEFGKAGDITPLSFALSLEEIEINEALWGMFDPAGEIPREPATISLDLGAEALWLLDTLEEMEESGQPPLMPQTMDLRNLFLSLGGATLQASGSGKMSMETGQPSGKATVEMKGLLTLVQKLAAIGILPPQQAMMAQALAPQFTRPGPDGEDHLISDIEAGADGSITVNGNRVK